MEGYLKTLILKKNNSIKRASQNKVYTKLILFKALLCYLTF